MIPHENPAYDFMYRTSTIFAITAFVVLGYAVGAVRLEEHGIISSTGFTIAMALAVLGGLVVLLLAVFLAVDWYENRSEI